MNVHIHWHFERHDKSEPTLYVCQPYRKTYVMSQPHEWGYKTKSKKGRGIVWKMNHIYRLLSVIESLLIVSHFCKSSATHNSMFSLMFGRICRVCFFYQDKGVTPRHSTNTQIFVNFNIHSQNTAPIIELTAKFFWSKMRKFGSVSIHNNLPLDHRLFLLLFRNCVAIGANSVNGIHRHHVLVCTAYYKIVLCVFCVFRLLSTPLIQHINKLGYWWFRGYHGELVIMTVFKAGEPSSKLATSFYTRQFTA